MWLEFVVGSSPVVRRDVSWVSVVLVVTILAWILATRVLGRRAAAVGERARADIPLPDG